MWHWPRLGELNSQRPARLTGGALGTAGCAASGAALDPGNPTPLQPATASSASDQDGRTERGAEVMHAFYDFIVGEFISSSG